MSSPTPRQAVLQWLAARQQRRTLWLYARLLTQSGQAPGRAPTLDAADRALFVETGWISADRDTLLPAGQIVAERMAQDLRTAAHPLLLPLSTAWLDEGRLAQQWVPTPLPPDV